MPPEEIPGGFNGMDQSPPTIDDIEMIAIVSGVVIWAQESEAGSHPGAVIAATDNKMCVPITASRRSSCGSPPSSFDSFLAPVRTS